MGTDSSSGNSSFDNCDVISLSRSGTTIAVALCYGILIPPIVIGNGLVVISFVINHKLRTATNIFICGLGLSDLLIGLFSVPYWTYISFLESMMDAYCTPSLYIVYICIDIWTGCASILQLTSIAIERLYFIVAPLRHRQLSRSIYWYMIGIAWLYSTFMAVLQPLQKNWAKEYSVLLVVTCFLFPLLIIVAVYLYILKVGRRQAQKRHSTRREMRSTGGDLKEFKVFITVIVITGVFVVAWAPFFMVSVIATLCQGCISHPEHDPLVLVVKWMQYSSSAINPYIYAYRNEEVRRSFKKILHFICFCGSGSSNNTVNMPRKGSRNLSPNVIEQEVQKTTEDDDNYRNEVRNVRPKNRQVHAHMINIDDLIGHTSSSQTNAPREPRTRRGELKAKQNSRAPDMLHDTTKENVRFYENKGFAGMKTSTREGNERHEDINRNSKEKRNYNKAYLQGLRSELHLGRQRHERYNGFQEYRNKTEPKVSKQSTNQNRADNSRYFRVEHAIRHNNETSHRSANHYKQHRKHDKVMGESAVTDHTSTCINEEMSADQASYV